jgi:hypothetical protein
MTPATHVQPLTSDITALSTSPGSTTVSPSPNLISSTRPVDVTSAGRTLIILGGLTVLAGTGLLIAYATGALQDRYHLADWFPVLAGISSIIGGLGVVAGFGVLRLDPTWRIVGMTVAVVSVIGMLVNLLSGVFLSLVFAVFWGRVVFRLARSAEAFGRHP